MIVQQYGITTQLCVVVCLSDRNVVESWNVFLNRISPSVRTVRTYRRRQLCSKDLAQAAMLASVAAQAAKRCPPLFIFKVLCSAAMLASVAAQAAKTFHERRRALSPPRLLFTRVRPRRSLVAARTVHVVAAAAVAAAAAPPPPPPPAPTPAKTRRTLGSWRSACMPASATTSLSFPSPPTRLQSQALANPFCRAVVYNSATPRLPFVEPALNSPTTIGLSSS